MGENSKIGWCTHTFNPWWGCRKISPACDHCYAAAFVERLLPDAGLWQGNYRTFGEKYWREPLKWNAKAQDENRMASVFCASMGDIFDKDAPEFEREKLWALIKATPWLEWLLLTKRIGIARSMLPKDWSTLEYSNVSIGATIVNQHELQRDIEKLLEFPALIRFISAEPLLGPIDLQPIDVDVFIDCVIAGGESGTDARPLHTAWLRGLRDQCRDFGVHFFFKQWGEYIDDAQANAPLIGRVFNHPDGTVMRRVGVRAAGNMLDGQQWEMTPWPR